MDKVSVSISVSNPVRAQIKPEDAMTARIAGAKVVDRGTTDYNNLKNKPVINGVTVEGNHSSEHYGILPFWFGTRAEYNALSVIDPHVCYCIEEGT